MIRRGRPDSPAPADFSQKACICSAGTLTAAWAAFLDEPSPELYSSQRLSGIRAGCVFTAGNRRKLRAAAGALSGSLLILDVGGSKRTFDERDVLQVTRRGGDSLANGALWGVGVGAGLGGGLLAAYCSVETCFAGDAWIIPIYGAMGAGIGVGVDALIRGERAVYRAPGRPVTVVLTPMFDKRLGVGVSLVF